MSAVFHASNAFRRCGWLALMFLSACNLQLSTGSATQSGPLSENTPAAATTESSAAGWKVEILSPQPGAEVPTGAPLAVAARCTGGETIEAALMVDANTEAVHSDPIAAGETVTLEWKAPTQGKHRLTVEFLDNQKTPHSAEIDILVTASGAAAADTPTPGGASVSFVSIPDGGAISAALDSAGFARTTVTVEAAGDEKTAVIKDIILEADGLQVARAHNDAYALPFRAELAWTPWRGNGKYSLTAYARTADQNENYFQPVAQASLTVAVEGLPAGTESLRSRFIRLYSERFGLSIPVPPLGRYIRPAPTALDPSQWVSAVYTSDFEYEIDLLEDGTVKTNRMPVNHAVPGMATICRPTGVLKMLTVFVDYGNTGITRDQAYAALAAAQTQSADWHRAFSAAHGLSAPLLEIVTTPAFISSPPVPGEFLTAPEILSRTGEKTGDYDLVAQVDLDSGASLSAKYHGLGFTLYGGCLPSGSTMVNLFMTAQSSGDLASALYGSLLVHELSHSLGWQHWWPTGTGGANDQLIWNYDQSAFPFLFFGWTDVDGDGTVGVLDQSPYGI
jgi:hypothetical protein